MIFEQTYLSIQEKNKSRNIQALPYSPESSFLASQIKSTTANTKEDTLCQNKYGVGVSMGLCYAQNFGTPWAERIGGNIG